MGLFGKKKTDQSKKAEQPQKTEQSKKAEQSEMKEEIQDQVKHPVQIAFEQNLKFLNQEAYPLDFFRGCF